MGISRKFKLKFSLQSNMESAGTITKQESEILNEEVSANVDESTEACAATGETQEPTEEELRFCKGCDYQAPDWTV